MTPKTAGQLCVALGIALACAAPPLENLEGHALRRLADVPERGWLELAEKRIYFGHQSVGDDILEGLGELTRRNPRIGLRVREVSANEHVTPGVLVHEKVGRNLSYRSKLDAFAARLDEDLGGSLDVALLKFCYVDIMPSTDVRGMFRDYEETFAGLRSRHPSITFVHVTEPLTWHLSGAPALLRRSKDLVHGLLGRRGYGRFFDNAPRNRFNELLRERYGEREPLFDLAAVESTYPDGRRLAYGAEGRVHFAMVPAYTDDGGHLNAAGRTHVAEQLLAFLADLALEAAPGAPRPGGGG